MIISSRGHQTANLLRSSLSQDILQASAPFFSAGCPPSCPHSSAFTASQGLQNPSDIEAAILAINLPFINAYEPPQPMPVPLSRGHAKKAESIIRFVNWYLPQNLCAEIVPSYLTGQLPWPPSLRQRPQKTNELHKGPRVNRTGLGCADWKN